MALDKPALKASILSLLQDQILITANPAQAQNDFADQLATIIDNYIKSAKITIPIGLVAVAGSATNQANPAPIVLTSSIT